MSRLEEEDSFCRTPPGVSVIRRIRGGKDWSLKTYRYAVLLITFVAYACYHASRKPSSIVKSVLYPPSSNSNKTNIPSPPLLPWPLGNVFIIIDDYYDKHKGMGKRKGGWFPFNGDDGTYKLGEIDVAFLACYSLGMYVAGHLGDTLDLRLFLTFGMIASGFFVGLFGMGYFLNLHVFFFYLAMQMLAGLSQATGWPCVVAVIGNWFGKRKRGLIMGIWNAHTSVGNITGSLLAAAVLDYGWGWSFIAPGALIAFAGIIVYLFLAAYPEDVGFPCAAAAAANKNHQILIDDVDAATGGGSVSRTSVGLIEACRIPGVIPFSMCLFFSKMVAYTFLFWLPFYLSQTEIGGQYFSVKSAGNLSTVFDVGGIIGGILAGYISDRLNARAITAAGFMYLAIPAMLVYRRYGRESRRMNMILMMVAGLFVNGPYALITTAVSADLGTHPSLRGDSRALATVTAIIDGTGSVGAALGPLLTGFLSNKSWNYVFIMLTAGALVAGLLLTRLVFDEIKDKLSSSSESGGGVSQRLLN